MKRWMLAGALTVLATGALADAAADLQKKLAERLGPTAQVEVEKTPIKGLLQVIADGQVFYMTADGRYLFKGQLLDLKTRQDLSEPALRKARIRLLRSLPADLTITYPAKGKQKREIWVFDDLDCPYCRKLHKVFPRLQAAGVTIHVLFFPRNGLGSPSYYGAIRVWCSKDRRKAFDEAMDTGQAPTDGQVCRHPINRHLALAQKLNVTGTPYMFLDDGEVIPGFVPPKKLIEFLTAGR